MELLQSEDTGGLQHKGGNKSIVLGSKCTNEGHARKLFIQVFERERDRMEHSNILPVLVCTIKQG